MCTEGSKLPQVQFEFEKNGIRRQYPAENMGQDVSVQSFSHVRLSETP